MTAAKNKPPRLRQAIRVPIARELAALKGLVEMLGADLTRLANRIEPVERLKAQLAATREHEAILASQVRRLIGEKTALLAYSKQLEAQLLERPELERKAG